ncbi:MAG: saccharopine dehydrogenase C-terminal domain-containing protein [Acidobacteriota bacterium]|nr:MAG: saccharopine dehydrogenase C-terminal domain-containing protein [Acidobacteriota bacterium]
MKKVLTLGAGRVSKPLVDYFIDTRGYQVTLADMDVSRAETIVAGRSLGTAVHWTADDETLLDRLVGECDIAVAIVPSTIHPTVARACLKHGKDMVTASFESPAIRALDAEAKAKGILILNENGEDPGLDHLGTQMLLDEVRADGGRVVSLRSFGSGIPSFSHNNNPMGYKFSWDPRQLLRSAMEAAVYYERGRPVSVGRGQIFDEHWLLDIEGLGTFEAYPNRDCTRYIEPFGLDKDASFYRGTLRYSGYCNTLRALIALGLLDSQDEIDFRGQSFRDFTARLIGCSVPENLEGDMAKHLAVDDNADIINRLRWLGLFEERPIPFEKGSRSDVLLHQMMERMSYAPHESDMIIVHIEVEAEFADRREKRFATLVKEGIPFGDSAMSRAVGLPTAMATELVLEGGVHSSGVQMPPTLPGFYKAILERLAPFGFEFTRRTATL